MESGSIPNSKAQCIEYLKNAKLPESLESLVVKMWYDSVEHAYELNQILNASILKPTKNSGLKQKASRDQDGRR